MSTRPTDWSALGLDSDPTPGDPDQVQDVYNLLNSLAQDYQTIWDTLNTVNGYASSDNLVGKTADALRAQMNGRITNFVDSARNAFPQVATAVNTYLGALNTQQGIADKLLTQAQNSGLKSDDPQVKSWATQAKQAETDLRGAESTAATAVRSAPGPSNPLSPWQEFLEILGWIALLLILPAMIFGGVVALIEFVVNAVLFVNALVQFAEGNLSFGGLLLAALGVIAPTTRALDLGEIAGVIRGIGSSVKTGIVTVRGGLTDFIGLLTSKGIGDLVSIDTLVSIGAFVLKAGVWVFNGLKNMPSLVLKAGDMFATKLGEMITGGTEKLFTNFKTGGWISAFLPVDATEIEKLGLVAGLKLGFVDRGLSFFPASHGLGDVAKTGFTGVHVADLSTNGFGRVTTPRLDAAGFRVPEGASLRTPSLNTNIDRLSFDAHIEAPHLSINNFAVSLVHSDLGLGKLSALTPVGFRVGHLELPDLRTPPELGRIGQGTTITHMSDVSFVTVHEDLVPQTVHMDAGAITTPSLHTADMTVPSLHTGNVSVPSLHTGNVTVPSLHVGDVSTPMLHDVTTPNLTATHLAGDFRAPTTIPSLHTTDFSVPTVRLGDMSGVAARPPAAHDLPSLGAIAYTKVSVARPDEVRLTRTDTSLTLNTTPRLADGSAPEAFAHLAVPVPTMPHLADAGISGIGHIETPALDIGHTAGSAHLGDVTAHAPGLPRDESPHLAAPDAGSIGHVSAAHPDAVSTHVVTPVDVPRTAMPHLNGEPAHIGAVPPEFRAFQATPEAHLQIADTGIRGRMNGLDDPAERFGQSPDLEAADLAPAASSAHIPALDSPAPHAEMPAPAVSSANLDEVAAHSAGTRGANASSPDLAGKPGLFDPNGERVAVRWTEFKQTQHDYNEAFAAHQQAFPEHDPGLPTSSSAAVDVKGKSAMTPGQSIADHELHLAAGKLDDAATALHALDADPARLKAVESAAVLDSLRERPRLLGGGRLGDEVLSVDRDTGMATRSVRGLSGSRLQLDIDHTGEHESGEVVRIDDGARVYAGRLTEIESHGGFRLTSPTDASVFREYRADGTVAAQGMHVTDQLGRPLGRLSTDRDMGLANLRTRGGSEPQELTYEAIDGGGHRLADPADGSTWWHFDDDGVLTGRGLESFHASGSSAGRLEVDFANLRATLMRDGETRTELRVTALHDGRILLTDPRDGSWSRLDADGRVDGRSLGVFDHAGTRLDTVEIDFSAGRADFTAPGLGREQWSYTREIHGFKLTRADGTVARFDEGGVLVGHEVDVRGIGGDRLGRLTIDAPNGRATLADADWQHVAYTVAAAPHGGFRLTDVRDGALTRIDAEGRVTGWSERAVDRDGTALDTVEIDFPNRRATFGAPGLGRQDWAFSRNDDGGFSLSRADGGLARFDATGRLVARDLGALRYDGGGLGHLELDLTGDRGTLTDAAGGHTDFRLSYPRQGLIQLTDPRDGSWMRIESDGRVVGQGIRATDHENTGLGVIEVDFARGRAQFAAPGLGRGQWAFSRDIRGFTLTGAGHNVLRFDDGGRLVGREQDVVHFNGEAQGRLSADYEGRLATLSAPGRNYTTLMITAVNDGEHLLTNARVGEWIRVDANGRVVGRSLGVQDRDGAQLTALGVDFRTGRAEFTPPGGTLEHWTFARDMGRFTLTRADGHRLVFSADGRLLEQHVALDGLHGATEGTRVHADFTAPGGAVCSVHDANGQIAHLTVTRTGAGHYVVTDTRPGQTHGAFSEYDRFGGTVRAGRANLLDHGGMFVEFGDTGARPTMALSDGAGPIGHFRATRDPATGEIVLTDTRGVHGGDTRSYSAQGAPLREHITITTPKGQDTGEHFEVDFTTMRWTRQDATGPLAPVSGRPHGNAAGYDAAYNGAGSVTRKNDGGLVLNGEDKTSAYERESLTIGQTLELTRQSDGGRYWKTWDTQGMTGWGRRHYSTESDGVSSWDVGRWGLTVREYRIAIDKGTIRAERLPDGSFGWARYTEDGDLAFSGVREYGFGGWTDKVTIGTQTRIAQRRWNASGVLGRALHYRENAVSFDANLNRFVLKETYKEISQQAKDAGSREMLTNGDSLVFTRYAEQRPPDFLWKSPENLDNSFSKAIARSPLGARYGGIDFPHDSAFLGDSRFQVFKWVERDTAHGDTVVSEGVRVLTPDGSFSDFAGDGVFVRGAIKLDDGHTIEIGRDAHGKWDTFALNGNARPANTLNWRELDSAKNVLAEGTRTFQGKQWIDHFADGQDAARVDRVARRTNADGTVVHYTGAPGDRPRYDAGVQNFSQRVRQTGNEISVTRNTMNQIIGRSDHWGEPVRAAGPLRVSGHGDPRKGAWEWQDANGGHGIRVSGRNTRATGAWDDSFADFRTNPFTHVTEQIRDFRDLGKGASLRAERDATLTWRSWKYDARGRAEANTEGIRQWRQADGTFRGTRPAGMKAVAWRDVHPQDAGFTMRELVDGRVREYAGRGGQTWKEYNFGSVWRERTQVTGRNGLYLEKESFQKQWRVTDAAGRLIRFRSASGNVWERDPFGRWTLGSSATWTKVGREYEDKGALTDLRGFNRRVREPNRFQFKEPGVFRPDAGNGAVGEFVGEPVRLAQKTFYDVLQDFTIDVGANIIIAGATDGWDFNGDAWGRILLGGALRSGLKGVYGVLTETAIKGFRDGLRNLDGGKDWNRNPYNNDKHWDNEWAGNENPPRWRANVFDFGVGQVFVPAVANFVANTVTAAVFGVGKDDVKLSGLDALKAGGLAMAGSTVGALSAGAVRTLGHQLFSGRLFHQGGLSDITLQFGEKLFLDYIINELIEAHTGLEAGAAAKGLGG